MSQNTTNAAFYSLPVEVIDSMDAERDAAAAAFWAYPGEAWQYAFEDAWLRERGHEAAANKAAECAAEVA
jgi:hypothetical protein